MREVSGHMQQKGARHPRRNPSTRRSKSSTHMQSSGPLLLRQSHDTDPKDPTSLTQSRGTPAG
eukprot:7222774-Pyramimonas_sp.AAC.1